MVVTHTRVPKPGRYRVTITLANRAHRHGVVHLRIGPLARRVAVGRHASKLSVVLRLDRRTLTVRAVGPRARPRVSISLRFLGERAPSSSAPPTPTGAPGSWKLVFDDEFNGTSLDTRHWSTGWFGSGISGPIGSASLECFDPSQVAVSGGALDLTLIGKPATCGGETLPYTGGIVTTNGKFQFTYGFTEARAWVPGSAHGVIADWPAIWTDGQNWPADGEDDILEGLGGQACWHFHDPEGGPGGCSSGSFTGGWHTFASDWEPGVVSYYYDGKEVGTITQGITAAPMYLIISLGAGTYGGPAEPGTLRVDYVRVWQH